MVVNCIQYLLVGVLVLGSVTAPSIVFAEKRNQLEELFIWKMSEELKLSASEEKKFTEIVKSINKEKAALSRSLQESVAKMPKLAPEKVQAEEFKAYKKNLRKYNHLNEDEVERMQALLGVPRTVRYLQIKQDLTNRVKSLLASPEASPGKVPSKPLPAPKIVEEK
ncbi:hypothetical protein D3C87_102400 [compost metagenome]